METLTISVKRTTEEQMEVKIPSFFKRFNSTFIAVLSKDSALKVIIDDYGMEKGISTCTPSIWIDEQANEITREQFYQQYHKILESFTDAKF